MREEILVNSDSARMSRLLAEGGAWGYVLTPSLPNSGKDIMRGYFAIGAEGISKPMNLGNLMRSAHAFGASFFFTVDAHQRILSAPKSDTSNSTEHLPLFHWPSIAAMDLPQDCKLVGVELTEDAVDLPSFGHPARAAYVLGPEQGSLSPEMVARCSHTIKIPTRFCINVAMAGAIVMYDRYRMLGQFAPRPVRSGAPTEAREASRKTRRDIRPSRLPG